MPGPSAPPAVQTLRMLLRPVSFSEDCRRRYGDTFRAHFTPAGEVVMVSDPDSLKRLFGADRVNTIAPGRNFALEPLLGSRSLLLLTGEEHLRRRRLMLPPFHGERMRAYEEVMREAADSAIDSWPVGRPFPIMREMQSLTLDVILRAVFGVHEGPRAGKRCRRAQGPRRGPGGRRRPGHDRDHHRPDHLRIERHGLQRHRQHLRHTFGR